MLLGKRLECKELGKEELTSGSFGGLEMERTMKLTVVVKHYPQGEVCVINALEIDITREMMPRPGQELQGSSKELNFRISDN